MPTPRSHGGAELQKAPLSVTSGFRGLNTQLEGSLLDFSWATRLDNTVLDRGNRIQSRKGWERRSTAGSGPGIARIPTFFEYETHAGVTELLCVDDDNIIWASKDDGVT